MPVPGVPVDGWTVVPDDQSVQPTNQLAISNIDPLLSQRPPIDMTPRAEAPPVVKSPFSLLGAPSAATGAFLGSLTDKPGDLITAVKAGGAALLKAPFQDVAAQPSPSKVLQEHGVELPGVANLFTDVVLDPTNLIGGEPVTGAGKAAMAMAAATPGVIKGLKGLTSRLLTDILPQIGKKGVTVERLLSLLGKSEVSKVDELTPALTGWLERNKHAPITREALEAAVNEKGLPGKLHEKLFGQWPGAVEDASTPYKYQSYALSGGDKYREALLHYNPGPDFDPTSVQWRELTKDELSGYIRGRDLYHTYGYSMDVPAETRAWIANDPEKTLILYDPKRLGSRYTYQQSSGRRSLPKRSYSTLDEAKDDYQGIIEKHGYEHVAPDQQLIKTDTGYKWTAPGLPDVNVEHVPTDVSGDDWYVAKIGEQRVTEPGELRHVLYAARGAQTRRADMPRLHYANPHFTGQKNVLAHMRVTDHEIEGGGKALHIDEIQSDWHTHESGGGRYYGYVKQTGEWIPPEYTVERTGEAAVTVHPKAVNKHKRIAHTYGRGATEAEALQDLRNKWANKIPPDAPFKGHKADELGFKRMLAHAAEHGYDAVTWTTGEQQAERYGTLIRQITAIRLTEDGELMAKTPNGWQNVQGNYAKPEDTAAVIGADAAARLGASDKTPSWTFTITDPYGETKTMSFLDQKEAKQAWKEASQDHKPTITEWDELSSNQQDVVEQTWRDAAIENDTYGEHAHEAAANWLHHEVNSHLADAEYDIAQGAIERAVEWAKEDMGLDLDTDTFQWSRDSDAGYWLKRNALRDKQGNALDMPRQMDVEKRFVEDANDTLDEVRQDKTKELEESDDYMDARSEAENEAINHDWNYMSDSDKFDLAKEHLDSDIFEGDGYVVGDMEKQGGAYHLDLTEHPLTIGSKGMEEEYDKVLPKVAQSISNRYGDGTKVQHMRINADDVTDRPMVARITQGPEKQGRYQRHSFRVELPDGTHETFTVPEEWEQAVAGQTAETRLPVGGWVIVTNGQIDVHAMGDRAFLERGSAEDVIKHFVGKQHEVWGLPITDKLRQFIKDKGLPMASVLWPAVGSIVTLKDGTRARVKRHHDDGTFDAVPVTKGKTSAEPVR